MGRKKKIPDDMLAATPQRITPNMEPDPRILRTCPDPNAPMEYFCAACRQKFVAHKAVRSIACPLCGADHLIMWHICPDCLQHAKADVIPRRPYKCPVCNGHGSESGCTALCHACKGTGIVWDGGEH